MSEESSFSIDPNALDVEWIRQPALYQKYARLVARAEYMKDQLYSKLDRDIRFNFKKYGFDSKPTEVAILSTIKGNKRFLKIQYTHRKLIGETKALEHKKKALEKLADLYLSGYWARPKIKTEAQDLYSKEERKEMEELLKKDPRLKKLKINEIPNE